MPEIEQLFRIWLLGIGLDVIRYVAAAGVVFVVLGVLLKKRLRHRRIQRRMPTTRQMRREFVYSVSTAVIFSSVGVATFFGPFRERLAVYTDIGEFGVFYTLISLCLMLILHDTYFYWIHRLMHHRLLFRHMHRVHHLSHTPTPWASYAFAPLEALLQALFLPSVVFWLPLHPLTILTFIAIMLLRNAIGHSGVEVFRRGFTTGRFGWSTTVTHHDLHHQNVKGNFGLYFTWWDRWMGTEHADYLPRFQHITAD